MNIAVLGFGTVGKGVYDIITENKLADINILHILRKIGSDKVLPIITDNYDDIISDANVDTVVECLGGLEPAHTYVVKALEAGKNVVSSNKLLVATYYDELIELANKKNVYILFESAVGGGIPCIENLFKVRAVDKVTRVRGIINATINFILYKMAHDSVDFDVALKEAQRLGYAEQDPSSDVDGNDVLYKSIIIANVASGKSYEMDNILKFGVRFITKADIDFFKENHMVCKLISEYDAEENTIIVMPELFYERDAIANVILNNNYIDIYCKTEGKLSFEGQGAGRYPTAHSAVQDIIRIREKEKKKPYGLEKVKVKYQKFEDRFYVKRKGESIGKFIDGMTEDDLRKDDIAFLAKVSK